MIRRMEERDIPEVAELERICFSECWSARILESGIHSPYAVSYTHLENAEKLSDIRGDVKEIGWGNQIRSYVLQPYTMVKDLRTGEETGNVANVLDGGLDPFISAYLRWLSLGCPDRKASAED